MTITENFLHASYSHESFLDLMTFFGAVGSALWFEGKTHCVHNDISSDKDPSEI